MACPNGRNFSSARDTTLLSEWDLVCEASGTAELSQTIFTLGNALGGIIGASISDRFGRKPMIVVSSFAVCVLEGILVLAPNIFMIYVVRLFSGFFYMGVTTSYFIIGMELLVPRHRQIYGVAFCLVWILQLLVLGGIAYAFESYNWRYLQGTIAAAGLLSVLYPFCFEESSRWLAVNGFQERTSKILKKASRINKKSFERVEMKLKEYWLYNDSVKSTCDLQEGSTQVLPSNSGKSDREKTSILTLIRNKRLLRLTFLTWFIWTTHNVTYYGLFMTSSDITGNRFLNYTLMSLVEIPSNAVILVMMNTMKRKSVLMLFLGLAAISLMTSSLFLTFSDNSFRSDIIITALFILGKFAIGSSFNVIYIMTPEMYPTNFRSLGNGVVSSAAKIGSMLAPFSRPLFHMAKWAPGLIFTVMCLISIIMATGLPETKDRALPNDVGDLQRLANVKSEDTNKTDEHICLRTTEGPL